jgi:bifunctional non-homologous end joining protein LigD
MPLRPTTTCQSNGFRLSIDRPARGGDLRRDPLAVGKATLASLLSRAAPGLRFNEHMDEEDGALVSAHTCKMGLEGIVSKLRDSRYRSGRSPDWIKSKNPNAPAVKREAEEDWGR